ncbi:hypothetical protein EV421DRAFT_571935 [Armillaria borealis]|uniref:Secreted protein n=1 Tax=Armillaria borealis TaxID=47425 RepID=A0AA39JIP7_9AGAR|nr:hypothetical protein EV421DRAFT_571935 [Armillaria borealis]
MSILFLFLTTTTPGYRQCSITPLVSTASSVATIEEIACVGASEGGQDLNISHWTVMVGNKSDETRLNGKI